MRRYLIGALLMGFGGMTAGGCAVGAGLGRGGIHRHPGRAQRDVAGAALTDRLIGTSRATKPPSPTSATTPVPASRAFT